MTDKETIELFENLRATFGESAVLEEFVQYMSDDTLADYCSYMARMWELPGYGDEDED